MAERSSKGDDAQKSKRFFWLETGLKTLIKSAAELADKPNGADIIFGLIGACILIAGIPTAFFNFNLGLGIIIFGALLLTVSYMLIRVRPLPPPGGPPNQTGGDVGKRQSEDKQDAVVEEPEVKNVEKEKSMSSLMKVYKEKGLVIENNYNEAKQELIRVFKSMFADTNIFYTGSKEPGTMVGKIYLEIDIDIETINERSEEEFMKLYQSLIECLEILHSDKRGKIELGNELRLSNILIHLRDRHFIWDVSQRKVDISRSLIDIMDDFQRWYKGDCDFTIKQVRDLDKAELYGVNESVVGDVETISDTNEIHNTFNALRMYGFSVSNAARDLDKDDLLYETSVSGAGDDIKTISDQHERRSIFNAFGLFGFSVSDLTPELFSPYLETRLKSKKNLLLDKINTSDQGFRSKQKTHILSKSGKILNNVYSSLLDSESFFLN